MCACMRVYVRTCSVCVRECVPACVCVRVCGWLFLLHMPSASLSVAVCPGCTIASDGHPWMLCLFLEMCGSCSQTRRNLTVA